MSGNDSAASVTESGNQLILWTPASGLGTSGIVAENESETLAFTYTATADRDITAVYDLFSYDREVEAAVLTLEQAIRQAIGEVEPAPVSFPLSGSPFFPQLPGLPR